MSCRSSEKTIHLDDNNLLDSIIEGIYLGLEFSPNLPVDGYCVIPNKKEKPGMYHNNKKVIITRSNCCSKEVLDFITDPDNSNIVFSRITGFSEMYPRIKFLPYILVPNFNIVWNGLEVTELEFLEEVEDYKCIYNWGNIRFYEDKNILSLPKIINPSKELVMDSEGNLTSIGWAMQQVGLNIRTDTIFKDLDILKTKKTLFRESDNLINV